MEINHASRNAFLLWPFRGICVRAIPSSARSTKRTYPAAFSLSNLEVVRAFAPFFLEMSAIQLIWRHQPPLTPKTLQGGSSPPFWDLFSGRRTPKVFQRCPRKLAVHLKLFSGVQRSPLILARFLAVSISPVNLHMKRKRTSSTKKK